MGKLNYKTKNRKTERLDRKRKKETGEKSDPKAPPPYKNGQNVNKLVTQPGVTVKSIHYEH